MKSAEARDTGRIQMRVSYVEIYQERVQDLLAPPVVTFKKEEREKQKLRHIRQEADGGLFLPDVIERNVRTAEEALEVNLAELWHDI